MKHTLVTAAWAVSLSVLALTDSPRTGVEGLVAQPDKFLVSVTPKPGQQIRYTLTDEFRLEGTYVGGTAENQPPRPSGTLAGKQFTVYTLVTDGNQQGHITSQLTLEQWTVEISYNGSTQKDDGLSHGLVKTYSVVFGANGELIALTAPGMSEEIIAPITQHIAHPFDDLPVTLSVGETVAQPLSAKVLKAIGVRGPFKTDGQVMMKLVSVEKGGAGRVANCEQSIDVTVVQAPDPSASPMRYATVSTTIRGSRSVQVNLDRGLVQSSRMELTFDQTETPVDAAYPTSKRHGVMKATVTGTD